MGLMDGNGDTASVNKGKKHHLQQINISTFSEKVIAVHFSSPSERGIGQKKGDGGMKKISLMFSIVYFAQPYS
jgi:hypothetical protein